MSFAVVLLALVGGSISILYLSGQVAVNHLPPNIPSYTSAWANYVPASFLQVGFENFTYTRTVNASVPPSGYVIQLISPQVNVTTSEVKTLLTVTLTAPNQTVDIAFLTHSAYDSINSSLGSREKYSNETAGGRIYFVGARANETTIEFGWLAPVARDSAIAFSVGYATAQSAVEEILTTVVGKAPSILSLPGVNRVLYLTGGPDNHAAMGLINFAGVVRTSNVTATAVDFKGGLVSVSTVVGFNSTQTAVSQYGYVKSVYKQYHNFTVYDEYVKILGNVPASQLEAMIRTVE